ncbi:hypothetical protein [Natrarchaeobaculum sulfurireducens]|uniref:Uncharacterized protein n=1 Tax=Natrarchaeobaculum sulfurireducens TaxID=2044521 RepID=A0A346PMG9_9EURY|nr:hypothetical protein [Natrarchaeobaculum sulfurireducens]AXR80714.1 hypothetical protein AArcMg_0692 [Natrarchaeobaculum sulfurireducens]
MSTSVEDVVDAFLNGEWLDGLVSPYTGAMGEAAFALMIAGVSTVVIATWSRSMTLTATWATLCGAFFIVLLPPPAAYVLALVITVGLAAAFYSLWGTDLAHGGR